MARQLLYSCLGGTEAAAKPVVSGTDGSARPEERSGLEPAPDLAGDDEGHERIDQTWGLMSYCG
jgi:hypothetical protein